MKQVSEIKKLSSQQMKADQIKIKLNEMFGQQAFSLPTIYKYMNEEKFQFSSSLEKEKPGRKPDEQLMVRIKQILEDEPFSSTIYRYLTQYIGLIFKHSNWIPHTLTDGQKLVRVAQSFELSKLIESCKHESYRNIITGDQKWCMLENASNGSWVFPNENPSIFFVFEQKMMLTVIWNPNGFYLIDFLPIGYKYNSDYFINNILKQIYAKKKKKFGKIQINKKYGYI